MVPSSLKGREVVPLIERDVVAKSSQESAGERSEPALSLDIHRTSVESDPGSSLRSRCPRGGYVALWSHRWDGEHHADRIVLPTVCKTWGCKSCSRKVLALFKKRVEIGISQLEQCAFMSVTYVLGRTTDGLPLESDRKRAVSVQKDWRRFLERLYRHNPELRSPWLKVVELTERKQPHLHIVVENKSSLIRCYGNEFDVSTFVRRMDRCVCLSHVWSRHWLAVTGNSYIVHAVPVAGAKRAAAYLAKYLAKDMPMRDELGELGFTRLWSTSASWPGNGRLRLRQTIEGGWDHQEYWPNQSPDAALGASHPRLEERVGPEFALEWAKKRSLKRYITEVGETLNAQNNC